MERRIRLVKCPCGPEYAPSFVKGWGGMMASMADETKTDDVEKFLAEEKAIGDRKKTLIAALLKQRETAIKDFDEKLAKLGYETPESKPKRSHHKRASVPTAQKDKAKA